LESVKGKLKTRKRRKFGEKVFLHNPGQFCKTFSVTINNNLYWSSVSSFGWDGSP
jgi:hypothetical protein